MTDSLAQVLPGFGPPGPGGAGGPGLPGRGQPAGRRGTGRERKRKRKKRRRSILVLLTALLVVGAAIGGAYVGLAPLVHKLTESDDFVGTGTTAVTVKVSQGASGRTIATVLTSAGVVKTQQAFLHAWAANTKSGQVQPGTYQLKKGMAASSALALLLDPSSRLTTTVTIPEGKRAEEIYTTLAAKLGLSRATLRRLGSSTKIGLPKAAGGTAEGYLFPATYTFGPDVTEQQVLAAMVTRAKQAYNKAGVSGSDLHDIAIKASIIQAESGNQKYMGPISRVLVNRLRINMPLSLDTTVSYGTNIFNVTTTDQQRASSSPYNTYKYTGLPTGPISNPGEDAINAAMHPTPGQWLYFVTINLKTGETKFSTDAATHERYRREFQNYLATH